MSVNPKTHVNNDVNNVKYQILDILYDPVLLKPVSHLRVSYAIFKVMFMLILGLPEII